ncbi:MAG: DUF1674 domain-containing protein [Gammaproteobacteria bacterium]|nr:DUF1674 domain-containing protein [Gammaproteobacteria bacterium]
MTNGLGRHGVDLAELQPMQPPVPDPAPAGVRADSPPRPDPPPLPREIGGPPGPEPTRYGDWEKAGRCIDF